MEVGCGESHGHGHGHDRARGGLLLCHALDTPSAVGSQKVPLSSHALPSGSSVNALGVFGSGDEDEMPQVTMVDFECFDDLWVSDDHDSGVEDLCSTLTSGMSLRSSIYGRVEENGRTYHRYKAGKYLIPNDELERDRLDLQHALFRHTLHSKLYLAPVGENTRRVLDIGTGTGIWAIEFANLYPSADVLGTDLSAIQPAFTPPNCHFEIDDAEDEWTFTHKFDYIHGRVLAACFADPASVLAKAFDALTPGGHLEMQDIVTPMKYVGAVPVDSALYKWNSLIVEASIKTGRPWTNVQHYPRYMRDIGFEDVQERKFFWPSSLWLKGKYFKTLSQYFQRDMLDGLEGLTMKLFTVFLGWTADEVHKFLVEVRRDLLDSSIHSYLQILVVYGRKPLQPQQPPAEMER